MSARTYTPTHRAHMAASAGEEGLRKCMNHVYIYISGEREDNRWREALSPYINNAGAGGWLDDCNPGAGDK